MQERDVKDLISVRTESANLDYKAGFTWTKDNRDKKYELVRDMLAMANTRDGGRIVFGVRDADYEFIGVNEEVFQSIDPSDVLQTLHAYGDPKVFCEISKFTLDGKRVVVFDVREFDDTPIICTESIKSAEQPYLILRKGAIYIRTSAATTEEIPSSHEMRELLGRAIRKKSDELLGSIERLITGKPSRPTPESANLYVSEIDLADKYFQDVLGKGFLQAGRLELIAHPVHYTKTRIADLPSIDKLLRSNKVYLRGWDFPHLDKQNVSNFNSGLQSFTDSLDIREGFRFYQSGLLVFKRALWEDQRGGKAESGNRTLSFISVIYTLTEFALFLKRLYEELDLEGDIRVVIRLVGCKDRELASYDGLVHLEPWYVCKEDVVIVDEIVRVVELKADSEGIARHWIRRVFYVFNWNDVLDETIEYWQKKLLERRL